MFKNKSDTKKSQSTAQARTDLQDGSLYTASSSVVVRL